MGIVPDGRLVYGMQLPIQSQSRLYVEDWELDSGGRELAAVARKADETGFFYIAVCDHTAVPREPAQRMGTAWYDQATTLGFLAAITERVRLLSHVAVLPYRHPLQVAKSFTTLDELSGGRAICGVGTGHVEGEFEALGVDFADRGGATDEAIDVLRATFADEWPEHAGERFTIRDVGVAPRPVQERLPIWVGGSTPPALRRAAVRGDGWLPQGTPRTKMPEQIAYLRKHREGAGITEPCEIGAITEFLYVGEPDFDVGGWCISGPPEKLAESLREFKPMGVSHVQIRFKTRSLQELLDQMDAFAAEVAPLLND